MTGHRNKPGAALTCKLTRKRCACGKQVTHKQLVNYGGCDACYTKARAAARASLPGAQP